MKQATHTSSKEALRMAHAHVWAAEHGDPTLPDTVFLTQEEYDAIPDGGNLSWKTFTVPKEKFTHEKTWKKGMIARRYSEAVQIVDRQNANTDVALTQV